MNLEDCPKVSKWAIRKGLEQRSLTDVSSDSI